MRNTRGSDPHLCTFGIGFPSGNCEKRLFRELPGRETMPRRKDKRTASTKRGLIFLRNNEAGPEKEEEAGKWMTTVQRGAPTREGMRGVARKNDENLRCLQKTEHCVRN